MLRCRAAALVAARAINRLPVKRYVARHVSTLEWNAAPAAQAELLVGLSGSGKTHVLLQRMLEAVARTDASDCNAKVGAGISFEYNHLKLLEQ